MPTSGNYQYTTTKREIIKDALVEAAVIEDDDSIEGAMYERADRRLNSILKELQTQGLHLWRTKDATLILEDSKVEYTLGGASSDRYVETLYDTTLTADALTAATTLVVGSTTGMTAADIIGVELDTGEIHWTTIDSVDSTTGLTLTDALPSGAVETNAVFAYTATAPKPNRIQEAYLLEASNPESSIPLNIIARHDYQLLNNKEIASRPVELYFRPDRLHSSLKVRPTSENNTSLIVFSAEYPIANMESPTDELGFPDYWFNAIHLSLAHAMARSYSRPLDRVRELKADKRDAIREAKDYDEETTEVQFTSEISWHY